MQYGTLVGAAEGLAEMIGVDNLLKIGSSATMRELMINLVKQGTAEGLEEGITTLLNNFSDQLVMGDKSNFSLLVQHYMDKDLGEEEAKRQAWVDMAEDLAFDVLGGFVSGTVHAGPETAYKTVVQAQETQTPQQTTEEIRTPAYEELIAKKDIPVIEVGRNAGNKTYAELREDALNVADFNGWYDAPFVNKDTNIPVFLTRKSFTHSASGLTESFGEDTLLALQQTPKLIENAVLTNAAPPRDPSKGESRVLTMFAAIKGSNGIEPIKITVKQFDNKPGNNPPKNILEYFRHAKTSGGYNTLYDMRALEVVSIESAKKEFDASGSAAGSTVQPEAKTTSNSNIRVADLLDLVKGDAEKYIPQKRDVTQVSAEGQTTNHETNARSALASPSPADSVPQNTAKVNGHFNEKRAQGMDTRGPSAAGEQTGLADTRGIEKDMDENTRQAILVHKKLKVVEDVHSASYAEDIRSIEALPAKAKSKVEKIIRPLAEKLGILNRGLKTPDVEIEFQFSRNKGLKESLSKQLRYGGSYADFARALTNLDSILKNAVLIEKHGDKYKETAREDRRLESVSVLLGICRDGETIIPVQMEIKESSINGGQLYVTVAMRKTEAGVLGRTMDKSPSRSLIPASEYSLPEVFSKINPADGHFLKYVPDGFLSDVQKEAKQSALREVLAREG